jgi:Zn finger protein HypA/HybF involved in hydrogenase expression
MALNLPRKWNPFELPEIVPHCTSRAQVITKLGLTQCAGNQVQVQKWIEVLELDTSHFLGQGQKGISNGPSRLKIPLEDILIENSDYHSHKLKLRLIKEGIKEHKCEKCNLTEWLGKSIPIELEHRNGNSRDHRFENLEILCPNCHAQTDTYKSKNKRKQP